MSVCRKCLSALEEFVTCHLSEMLIWSEGPEALLGFGLIVSVCNMTLLEWKWCHLGAFPLGVKKPIIMPVADSWHAFIG